MNKLFLSGGGGFLGKHFIEQCHQDFTIVAPLRAELELTNTDQVDKYFAKHSFDYLIHSANIGGTRKSQLLDYQCLNANLKAFTNVFKQKDQIKRLIQLGSGAEYARPLAHGLITEEELLQKIPQDEYGFAKLICSQMIKSQTSEKAVSLHLFAIFGAYEDYQMRFISNAIVRTLFDLPITINQDVVFDYLYVKDCIRIIKEFVLNSAPFSDYNIGSGIPIKLTEIAEVVKKVLNSSNDIIVKQKGMGQEYSCNIERLKSFLPSDFQFTPLAKAIEELSQWYIANMNSLNKDWILAPV